MKKHRSHRHKPWRVKKSHFGFVPFDWEEYARFRAIPLEL